MAGGYILHMARDYILKFPFGSRMHTPHGQRLDPEGSLHIARDYTPKFPFG
jgi:hypothetical protein